jgi:wobble nucleotide-excising tRNase
MLERIAEIKGIGLLHQSNGKKYSCHKATLVYADNGRGKSTLATIFRSASGGNAALIAACKTVDGTLPPKVVLQFGSGHKVSFENGVWSEQRPELLVFDADFIGRNVHSGGAVSTEHRKNLLEFALGEPAVSARIKVDKATGESKAATEKAQNFESQLASHHIGLTITQFEQLAQVSDIDKQISELQKRLIAANNVVALQTRPVPKMLAEPSFDINGLFAALGLALKDIHGDAEKLVKQHISKLGGKGAEGWLSQGRLFGNGDACPYCDQDLSSNDLVHAYQTHFNVAYGELKSKISVLQDSVASNTSENIIDAFAQSIGVAVAQAATWAESVPTQPISFDIDAARVAMISFRNFVIDLIRRKVASPADALGSADEKTKAGTLWEQVLIVFRSANATIKAAEDLITSFKAKLSGDSVPQLQQHLLQLQATKRRFDPKVIEVLKLLANSRKEVAAAEKVKKAAREELDNLMKATLIKYQASINTLLANFGASFSIKGLSANFRGNAPRSEYGLLLRGKDVTLEGGSPSFATALSDGDKRTLAFAFFIASTLDDAKLGHRVVVIDDPMCSLDMNRRHHTRAVLKKLHSKAEQLIVLAHDSFFLRDLRDALRKDDKATSMAFFQLKVAPLNYTDFDSLDLDKECESPYSQHHRLLYEFSAGNGGDLMSVAKAIRPLLEGYLHRRFPGLLPKDMMFGNVIAQIRDSASPSPLCHAKNLVDELNEINEYAGDFHHDTNADADTVPVTATGLKIYVDRTLSVVHRGNPP